MQVFTAYKGMLFHRYRYYSTTTVAVTLVNKWQIIFLSMKESDKNVIGVFSFLCDSSFVYRHNNSTLFLN